MPSFLNERSVGASAFFISIATLASRLLGITRDRLFAYYFGSGQIMDAYFTAFRIPDLIYNLLVAGALTAGFIPVFTQLWEKSNKKVWLFANNVLNILALIIITLCILGIIFTPALTFLIAPGLTSEKRALVIEFTRIMLISPIFLSISAVMGGILQSLQQFLLYSIAPIFYNLGIIIGTVIFVKIFGIIGLPIGVVFGSLLHCLVQIYGAYKTGWRWRWRFIVKDSDTLKIGKLMIPRTFSLGLTQITTLVVTILASYLPTGSISSYNFANNLQGLPIGLIGIPLAVASFPALATFATQNKTVEFAHYITKILRQIFFYITPLSLIFILLRIQIVRVGYGTGLFNWENTITTAQILGFFALGITANALTPVLIRGFFAWSNTKTPFIIAIITEIFTILLAIILIRALSVAGLSLAEALGDTCGLFLLSWQLHRRIPFLKKSLIGFIAKTLVALLAMTLAIQGTKLLTPPLASLDYLIGVLIQGLFSGIVGLLTYSLVAWILKIPEAKNLFHQLRRAFRKKTLSFEENQSEMNL